MRSRTGATGGPLELSAVRGSWRRWMIHLDVGQGHVELCRERERSRFHLMEKGAHHDLAA